MPVTGIQIPILAQFLCVVENTTGMPAQPLDATPQQLRDAATAVEDGTRTIPKGMVLGPDGKPCRTCTSSAEWAALMKPKSKKPSPSSGAAPSAPPRTDCPPDVEVLGRSAWTLLHSITATYPEAPTAALQRETRTFVSTFAKLYPCWHCAEDFQRWLKEDANAPRVSSREEFGRWMCDAHNAVNVKLGKEKFDCGKWEERWRTGWKNGSCD